MVTKAKEAHNNKPNILSKPFSPKLTRMRVEAPIVAPTAAPPNNALEITTITQLLANAISKIEKLIKNEDIKSTFLALSL